MTPRNRRTDGSSTTGNARNFTLRLTDDERARLDVAAAATGTDRSTVIRAWIATLPAPKVGRVDDTLAEIARSHLRDGPVCLCASCRLYRLTVPRD